MFLINQKSCLMQNTFIRLIRGVTKVLLDVLDGAKLSCEMNVELLTLSINYIGGPRLGKWVHSVFLFLQAT